MTPNVAFGQKQTCAAQKVMSALPRADIVCVISRPRDWRRPFPKRVAYGAAEASELRKSSKAYGVGPTGRPGIQIRHGKAHSRYRSARLQNKSMRVIFVVIEDVDILYCPLASLVASILVTSMLLLILTVEPA